MGRVVARIKVENLSDVLLAEAGSLAAEQIRSVEKNEVVIPNPEDGDEIVLDLFATWHSAS